MESHEIWFNCGCQIKHLITVRSPRGMKQRGAMKIGVRPAKDSKGTDAGLIARKRSRERHYRKPAVDGKKPSSNLLRTRTTRYAELPSIVKTRSSPRSAMRRKRTARKTPVSPSSGADEASTYNASRQKPNPANATTQGEPRPSKEANKSDWWADSSSARLCHALDLVVGSNFKRAFDTARGMAGICSFAKL